jgi:phenylalanine-4-hydroxylase
MSGSAAKAAGPSGASPADVGAPRLAGPAAAAEDLVQLDPDHPGFRDPVYRARRNEIARVALAHREGDPMPRIAYADDEHAVWRTVWKHLEPLHRARACRSYREHVPRLPLDHARIPQLAEVNAALARITTFQMTPVAGLVASRQFLAQLGRSRFLSTQYIRHASRPLYTPEPDVVHELVGHAASFCSPELAELNRLFGRAAAAADDGLLTALERLYWFTVEFGVVREDGELNAYGAGLLSSFGELERFRQAADLQPFDPDVVAATPYDPTDYQKVLYVVDDLGELRRTLEAWLASRGKLAP